MISNQLKCQESATFLLIDELVQPKYIHKTSALTTVTTQELHGLSLR